VYIYYKQNNLFYLISILQMNLLRIALLTNIAAELGPDSTDNESVFAYELASALIASGKDVGGISVDIVARKSQESNLPVISVDLSGLGEIPDDPLHHFAYQDAIYSQLLMSGMLNDYALVHCLAPIVTPLLLLAANGIPVVQTITTLVSHPCVELLPKLIGSHFRQVKIGPYQVQKQWAAIPPSVDLTRFRPVDIPSDNFILCIGNPEYQLKELRSIAGVGLPLYTLKDGNPEELVKHAKLVMDLSYNSRPCDPVWLIRALACGTPISGWSSLMSTQLFRRPELGFFVNEGDIPSFLDGINNIIPRNMASSIRREYAQGLFGQRSQAARYRDIYKSLLMSS
jgi:hypothetical protein